MCKQNNLVFVAKKISTGEEREFTFDDLCGYEGEECGVFIGNDFKWILNFNSGYGFNGMNEDIEIRLK